MQGLSKIKFEFNWEESKHFHSTGTEVYNKDFEARVTTNRYLEDYQCTKHYFEVYNENGEIYHKSDEEYDTAEKAKLEAEIYLKSAVEDFCHKIS